MADITITIPDAQLERVRAAITELLRLEIEEPPRQADVNDFRAVIADYVKSLVRRSERRVAEQVAQDGVTDVDIT